MNHQSAEHLQSPDQNVLESTAAEVVALCGGDAFAAVRTLLVANEFLERELRLTRAAVSHGYSRGWHAQRNTKAKQSERP
jgi:hypothetical protein